MKTRDIKTSDSASNAEESQETTKKVVQPLSPSQPTRQRAPRNSQKTTRPQEVEVQKPIVEAPVMPSVPVERVDRDIVEERKDVSSAREEYSRPAQQQQQPYHHQSHSSYERSSYTKRPLEDLSLSELVQYARRYGIMGAAITKKDELLRKVRYAEENPNFEMAVEGVLEKLPDGFG